MVESEDAGVVYNTRQAAEALGVGSAMMRRYAQTLEEITGEEVPQTRRDGRQFSRAHLDTLLRAKALVDSHNGLSVEAALRMATSATRDAEGLPMGVPMGSIADSAALIAALQEAITEPLVAELRAPNAALLFAALSEAVTVPLVAELREVRAELRQGDAEVLELRSRVAALEAEKTLPPATPERIDRALEVEMLEGIGASESPTAVAERQQGDESSGSAPGAAGGSLDGPMVRAARWLERWLYRKG